MSIRKSLPFLGVFAILGVAAYAAYYMGWFARDAENAAEMARARKNPLEQRPAAAPGTGWFQWRGPTRDGRAPEGKFRTDWDKNPPKLLWKADTLGGASRPLGGGYSSPVVVGDSVYIQDYKDGKERVVCLEADTGKFRWETSFDANYTGTDKQYAIGPRATLTVEGNTLYVVSGAGKLLRIDKPADGPAVPTWQHDFLADFDAKIPQWGVACSPLVEGDLVIVQPGGKTGSVVAFDKVTGEVRWRAGTSASGYSSPVVTSINGERTVFALTGDSLLAIRTSDGKVMATYPWNTKYEGNVATPLVVENYVFISSAYQQGCALLRAEGKGGQVNLTEVYARRGRGYQNHHSSSVFKDRYLFGYDGMMGSARLKCVDFHTGREKADWEADTLGTGSGSIILAGNHLIIQTERGDLALVEATAEEFRLVAKIPKVLTGNNNWATPTLVDGRLYLRDEVKVLCFDLR